MEMKYQTWGDPKNPPVLLLHALACHSGWWKWVTPYLEKEYYLIAPDFRGHGQSPWADSYRFDDYARDIEELVEKFDGPYAIVGHSMGAYVGLKVASRGVRPPSALLVADMKMDSPEEELAGLHKAAQKSGRIYDTLQDAVANYRFLPPQHAAPKERVEQVAQDCYHEQEDGRWGERFDRRALAIEKVEAVALAEQVNCPTWFVRAKESQVMPAEGAKELARITGGPLHEMEGVFHHLPLEAPEAFASLIREFMIQTNNK
ncbi:alpha/beta fold hydrolase [Ammoniphilus sp. CFH 90114]|uniref:alpha/beta fold hydrolase n=1 Tax=Ammoniphilus sp. CFH 90114 TaxID=2493665 RepID=UPI0013E95992|nr:alpha/beta hydrolase [Ammoniphilus sp. CFH 90114]